MKIEGLGDIAKHLSQRQGRSIGAGQVRRWINRAFDPLPAELWNGLWGVEPEALDEWADRQRDRRRGGGGTYRDRDDADAAIATTGASDEIAPNQR